MPTPVLGLFLTLLCFLRGSTPPRIPPPVGGHLVLVIQGDAHALRVTAVVPKPDPFGGTPRGLESDHSIAVLGGDGRVLGLYPLDLSWFDLDPARVGTGTRVEGCKVVDTEVTALASVPRFRDAAGLTILRGNTAVGTVSSEDWQDLVREGERR